MTSWSVSSQGLVVWGLRGRRLCLETTPTVGTDGFSTQYCLLAGCPRAAGKRAKGISET